MSEKDTQIPISPKRIFLFFVSVSILLILLHILTYYLDLYQILPSEKIRFIFNLNAEANIPTTFTVLSLGFASLLLILIAKKVEKEKGPFLVHWLLLAFGFFFISIDEGAMLHESLIGPLTRLLDYGPYGIFTFSWVLILVVIVIITIIVFFNFYRHLPKQSQIFFAVSGIIYILGAVGFEILGGYILHLFAETSPQFFWVNTVEESFEMIGVCIFIYALTSHLFGKDHTQNIVLALAGKG